MRDIHIPSTEEILAGVAFIFVAGAAAGALLVYLL